MALVETTLSSACGLTDSTIVVAAATSFAVGRLVYVDGEMMKVSQAYDGTSTTVPVLRGLDGSTQLAHVTSARVVHGLSSDFVVAPGQTVSFPSTGRTREIRSYTASGAITMPTAGNDMLAILNGTSVLTMTLADPTLDLDGCILYVGANGVAAHTLTNTTGFGGAGSNYDVLTWNGTGTAIVALMALNERWHLFPGVTGTLTNEAAALA